MPAPGTLRAEIALANAHPGADVIQFAGRVETEINPPGAIMSFSVTVIALDAYGNIATGYTGTTHFTSTDSQAILPANYTFTAADVGVHTFTVTFNKTGTQTLTATDTHTGSIKGTASIKVS